VKTYFVYNSMNLLKTTSPLHSGSNIGALLFSGTPIEFNSAINDSRHFRDISMAVVTRDNLTASIPALRQIQIYLLLSYLQVYSYREFHQLLIQLLVLPVLPLHSASGHGPTYLLIHHHFDSLVFDTSVSAPALHLFNASGTSCREPVSLLYCSRSLQQLH
jgi:uncharacterized protein (DUF58 family)